MPPRQKIDFAHYESQYPRIFRLLRDAGWNERRAVDFPDVDEGSDGKLRGHAILHDRAHSFLQSFYGLRVAVPKSYGERGFLIGFGPQWDLMEFDRHHDKVQDLCSDIAGDGFAYPILSWDRCVAFSLWDSDQVIAIDDNYQVCFKAKDPFQLMEWILDPQSQPEVQRHDLEYIHIPQEYWHLAAETHPLAFHLRQYRPLQLTDGNRITYVLESVTTKVVEVEVTELVEEGEVLSVKYRTHPWLADKLARQMIVYKLLDEWLEGRYRKTTELIRFENVVDQRVMTAPWPDRLT